MNSAEIAVAVSGLVRSFGGVRAIDELSFSIARGEIFGFLGHNGAGKTTTVRVLNGVLGRDAGVVRVLGRDPARDGDALRAHTGVLTEMPAFDERFSARENLAFIARLHGLAPAPARARAEALLEELGLAAAASQRVATFSKGMKQKLAIVRALLHEPELVYFDEPTSGLDPEASHQLATRMRRMQAAGVTQFFTTHRLSEAAELCDRVAIVRRGRVIAAGTPRQIAEQVGGVTPLEVEIAPAQAATAMAALASRGARVEGEHLVVDRVARAEVPDVVAALVAAGVRVYGARLRLPTLEEAYLSLNRGAES